MARSNAKRLAVFNHKGGIGKTTITVNLASALGTLGLRVLLVDTDPQCNLTSYFVEEKFFDSLLDASDTDHGNTLWTALRPVVDGSGDPRDIRPIELPRNLFLLAGDIRLAEFEAELSPLWGECFQRRPRGLRGTTSLSALVSRTAAATKADIVMFDTGPNIGPLNRILLLDCDNVAVPAACDYFSVRAIKTLGHTLVGWVRDWKMIAQLSPDDQYLLPGSPRPIGYIPQRFKIYRGVFSAAYADMIPIMERAFDENLLKVLGNVDNDLLASARSPFMLGEVKEFGSIANEAQRQGLPMWRVDAGTPEQRHQAETAFLALATTVADRIGVKLP